MALYTKSNDIKPMLRLVAFIMVVFLCWFSASTLQQIWPRQFALSNSIFHSLSRWVTFGMTSVVMKVRFFMNNFAFFGLSIFTVSPMFGLFTLFALMITFCDCFALFALIVIFLCSFTLFALVIPFLVSFVFFAFLINFQSRLTFFAFLILMSVLFITAFALILKSIFFFSGFIKLRALFDLFASGTPFCYDLLRHGRFSLCVERLCLEPIAGHIPVVGSLYNNIRKEENNHFFGYLGKESQW